MLPENQRNLPESTLASLNVTSSATVPELQQKTERLRNVAAQVESFLIRQIDRLQRELEQAETVGDRFELEQLTDDFSKMREKWDVERQTELARLQEDSGRLVEAWQKLEAEQRELLKHRVPSNLPSAGISRPIARSVGGLGPNHPMTSETVMACAGAVATATSHKSQIQFQQLRREMMEHARQRRKQ